MDEGVEKEGEEEEEGGVLRWRVRGQTRTN